MGVWSKLSTWQCFQQLMQDTSGKVNPANGMRGLTPLLAGMNIFLTVNGRNPISDGDDQALPPRPGSMAKAADL